MNTAGPRSVSLALVAISRATRSGLLRMSSATVCSHDNVIVSHPHNESATSQSIEGPLHIAGRDAQGIRDVDSCRAAQLTDRLPRETILAPELAHHPNAIGLFQHQRQAASLEHRFDRLPVLLGDATKQ